MEQFEDIICINSISKQYRLGQIGGTTLRDELQRFSARMHHKEDPTRRIDARGYNNCGETFLALDDISFEVKKGERVGIIGRNGAGKSTLLKLISRVTAPTSGWIGLNGRVASMLEVGTGFHGELTGRENIYMNGAILGMSKREIDKKMEDIIEFSECRQFIDTPVKRYSSGMYVKLAFSVAAHLDSEIMIMDEVLAVGDVAFQNKCLSKMNDVSRSEGRTILYVSHNMNTIRTLCDRCIVLDRGKLIFDGTVNEGIDMYLSKSYTKAQTRINLSDRKRNSSLAHSIKLMSVELLEKEQASYEFGEEILLRVKIDCYKDTQAICLRIELHSSEGTAVGTALAEDICNMADGETRHITMALLANNIVPGQYYATLTAYQKTPYKTTSNLDWVRDALAFEILDTDRRMPLVWDKSKWGSIMLEEVRIIDY